MHPLPSHPDSALDLLDTDLGERMWPHEAAITARITDLIQRALIRRYPSDQRPVRRDAHPKAHGCVRAEFRVEHNLPARLAHGVFYPGARYHAWVRFSNGNPDPTRHDMRGDARGMAIKLIGVPGQKVLHAEQDARTQDFVLISHPTFFAADPARYATFLERATSPSALGRASALFALGWQGASVALRTAQKRIVSPLETRYWSTVPSQLGLGSRRMAVKYSVRPSAAGHATLPADPSPDFLREALISHLREEDASFDFLVQPRSGDGMSVEDPRERWDEGEAPMIKAATLLIPRQIFTGAGQETFGENLSFTPWHTLPHHRPLGGMNRVRRDVYQAISTLRHALNGITPYEPSGEELFPQLAPQAWVGN